MQGWPQQLYAVVQYVSPLGARTACFSTCGSTVLLLLAHRTGFIVPSALMFWGLFVAMPCRSIANPTFACNAVEVTCLLQYVRTRTALCVEPNCHQQHSP
jgi:hypothetical protein